MSTQNFGLPEHTGQIVSVDASTERLVIKPDDNPDAEIVGTFPVLSGFSITPHVGLRCKFTAVRRSDGTLVAGSVKPELLDALA